jgi:hypothetical protein
MAHRRAAITALVAALALAGPACRFSRNNNDSASPTTTAPTVALFEDTSTSFEDTTTTTPDGSSSTTRKVATTVRQTAQATTHVTTRPATTARPTTTVPHCDASAADTYTGGTWTVSVTSSFPNSQVTIDLKWSGGSGNYSGITDSTGSFSKSQTAGPSMRGQRVVVNVTVASRSCSTSFMVS